MLKGLSQNGNRVLVSQNIKADPCLKLTTTSKFAAKEAANSACAQAFDALDRLEGNLCKGWRHPECRLRPGFTHFQCSCAVSFCDLYEIRNNQVSTFLDCAWKIYSDEILRGRVVASSTNFRRGNQSITGCATGRFSLRPIACTFSGVGNSQVLRTSSVAGRPFSSVKSMTGRGTLWNGQVPVAGPSQEADFSLKPITTLGGLPQGLYVCFMCGHEYASQQSLRDHEKSHKLNIHCCNRTFSNKGNYNHHRRKFHPNPAVAESVNRAHGPYVCGFCGKSYHRSTSLAAHTRVHAENIHCKFCDVDFSNKANYKRHMEQKHPKAAEAEEEKENTLRMLEKPNVCEKCGARFTAKKMLQEHMALHRGETFCNLCDQTFPRKAALSMHIRKAHQP